MSRQLPVAKNSDWLGPVGHPVTDELSSSNLTHGLGNGTRNWSDSAPNIWSNGLSSNAGDSSRNRDTVSLGVSNGNGSSATAFSQSLNNDAWSKHKSRWEPLSRDRSSAVSPARRNSRILESTEALGTSPYQNSTRTTPNGLLSNSALSGLRHSEFSINGTPGHYSRDSIGSSYHRGSNAAGILHSPIDDRSSAVSEPFFAFSSNSSRNPSQPPSRHENNEAVFSEAPFSLVDARGHTSSVSSLSGGRYPSSRHDSVSNDYVPSLDCLSLTPEQLPLYNRPNVDAHSAIEHVGSAMSAHSLQALQVTQNTGQGMQSIGTFTPDAESGFKNPLSRRGYESQPVTPVANGSRQASLQPTPPILGGSYQQFCTGRLSASANPALLQRRLRSIQHAQTNGYRHNFLPASTMGGFRQPFPTNGVASHYNLTNALPVDALSMQPQISGYGQAGAFFMLESEPRPTHEQDGMTLQSQLLADFRASTKGTRQWQLRELQGHIVEFCGDQAGSRFIQTKLEQANSDDKQLVFTEILPDVIQLMQDVFGNYVVQKFFDHGDQSQKAQIAGAMKGHLFHLSTQMYACRVVQKAIDHILTAQQAALIKEIEPNIIRCVKDMNGNHVIQKAIQRIPDEHIKFILDAFTGKIDELVRHAYGCRVLQRVLEHSTDPVKHTILTELHNSKNIIDDQYGNYVVQHMIAFGFLEDKERVINQIKANVIHFSTHKFASNVVEKCFHFGTHEQKHELLMAILNYNAGDGDGATIIVANSFGNYVAQKMLDTLSDSDWLIFYDHIKPVIPRAKHMGPTSGKQVAAVEKKMTQRSHLVRSDSVHSPLRPPSSSACMSPPYTNRSRPRFRSPTKQVVDTEWHDGTASTPQAPTSVSTGFRTAQRFDESV